ncbi:MULTISPECIES: ribonuclease P protein component [Nitrincola]|uniref:Ribonuclease P protein component n=2 Tax=Nitrincola TaxID=267849 RepID=A0A364NMB5_9GAMM|nr:MULTISPECIES: ribonuclease P protein component [Nitrincola]EXJ10033.1 Ribonuclease P protein component [Nitrincola nitratireducens]RAU18025.1 ribonuclease P protein component [Nitrincola tibetensis]
MAEFGYPRQLRLLTGGDFKQVFDRASLKVSDPSLLILANPNQLGHPRIGFVISKKNVRRAVKRNRIRRIIRESFRLQQHDLPAIDMVILARKGLDTLSNEEIVALINRSWSKLKRKASNVLKEN